MSKRLPPLNSLRAFEAAARHLSFTRAADELHVTQAAISHQVKALEDFLGVTLFVRSSRNLLLTEEGQMYWPAMRDLFERLADATERVRARKASGPLTVAVLPSFAIVWLVPRLQRFSEKYPEIDVRIKASEDYANFLGTDVDAAIYFGNGDWPDLQVTPLLEESLLPICSPSLLRGRKPLATPQDLGKHTLLHDGDTVHWRRWLQHAGVKGVRWQAGPVFSHTAMVLQAAAHGQGVAISYSVLAQAELLSGRLICPFDQRLPLTEGYFLVTGKNSAERPKVKAFREWLLATIAQEKAEALVAGA